MAMDWVGLQPLFRATLLLTFLINDYFSLPFWLHSIVIIKQYTYFIYKGMIV